MLWAHRVTEDFEPSIRGKGGRLYKAGGVRLTATAATRIAAKVDAHPVCAVVLRLESEAVVSFCECRLFTGGELCEHIWATVLAAEAGGCFTRLRSAWDPVIAHGLDRPADMVETEIADFPHEPADFKTSERPTRPPRLVPKPPRDPQWKTELSVLRQLALPEFTPRRDSRRRVLYFVDLAESIAGNALVIRASVTKLKNNGEWGRPNFHDSYIREVSQLEAQDRQLLALLSGGQDYYGYGGHVSPDVAPARRQLPRAAHSILLPMLSATGRFFLQQPGQPAISSPIGWDGGEPWQFRVTITRDEIAGQYVAAGVLKRSGEERAIAEPVLLLPGVVIFKEVLAAFDDAVAFEWVRLLRRSGPLRVPFAHRTSLLQEFATLSTLPPMDAPDELRIEPAKFVSPPSLTIRSEHPRWQTQQKLVCQISFDYGGTHVPDTHPSLVIHDPANDKYVLRDRNAEQQALERITALGVRRRSTWDGTGWEITPSRLPLLAHTLVAEGWRVEAQGNLYRRAGMFKVHVTSGIDWLELSGQAEFEGQIVELPDLLKAVARGDKMVRLGDGSFGLLPEDWLERYRTVAGFGKSEDGRLRFTNRQVGLLDALLATQPEVTFDEGFLKLRQELESFAGVQATDPPPTFQGQLRDYQKDGLGWLHFLRRFGFGGCLADDMGLGKTVQVLALLDSDARQGPVIVVVPRSLIFNWKQEATKFAPRLKVLDLTGIGRKGRWDDIRNHDVILTTYGTLRRDIPRLKEIRFDTVILDEAQAIKNASTESAKAARLLVGDYRLALTGTPVENRLADLWSLFEFLNPGLLGNATIFKTQTTGSPTDEAARVLSKALRPFLLRRTKEQVAKELPERTEQTIYCELEGDQRRMYNELREHYRAALLGQIERVGIQKSRMKILEALLRLRQAACHPGLIDKARASEPSAKIDTLVQQLQEVAAEGHKALVFSQFTSLLSILRSRLDDAGLTYEYLDGKTRDREARVRNFQEDAKIPLFLISLKAGGLGLNLTAAEYVFLLDPWWNPAVEAQAIDRTHRIGQSRHVFAYRLIARDTVEEKVLDLQKTKRALADAIVTADNSVLTGLDRETLEVLLS